MINIEQIMGLDVVTSGANIIGQVKGAKFDPSSWQIKFLNVNLTGTAAEGLGMKKGLKKQKYAYP